MKIKVTLADMKSVRSFINKTFDLEKHEINNLLAMLSVHEKIKLREVVFSLEKALVKL